MSPVLLSVPPALRDFLHSAAGRPLSARLAESAGAPVFAEADPLGRKLGSGGGTLHLLHRAWLAETRGKADLFAWLAAHPRLVLNSGGESRRLPAYAALGKALMPIPGQVGALPRRFDQMLADFQFPAYRQVLREAGPRAAVLVAAGDVWLDFDPLQIPAVRADIVGLGMKASARTARHFGVFFAEKGRKAGAEHPIAFFRQKPDEAEIRQARRHDFYVDTGMWLLSAAALRLLFGRCGWDERRRRFATEDGFPAHLDLYTEIGDTLGRRATPSRELRRLGWGRLKTSVVALERARFLHLGSTRQVFESFAELQPGARLLRAAAPRSAAGAPRSPAWLGGVPARPALRLAGHNFVTGLPVRASVRRLAAGWCLDAAPVGRGRFVVRPYHLDDALRGRAGAGGRICGREAGAWLAARGLPIGAEDVFALPLYPVVAEREITQRLVEWFFAARPDPALGARIARRPRLAAAQIAASVDFARYFAQARSGHVQALREEFAEGKEGCLGQDVGAVADFCRRDAPGLGRWLLGRGPRLLARPLPPVHAARLLHLLAELSSGAARTRLREAGRRRVQRALIEGAHLRKVRPRRSVAAGRTVWAQSPVRLDLAGGWTDTPPHCLERGGAVLNLAVRFPGPAPVQVSVAPISEPVLRLESQDLDSVQEISTYAQIDGYRDPRAGFSLAKASLALAGFHPDFIAGRPFPSLRRQLQAQGGGWEISILSTVPKGSGLGTSSILAAAILAALDRACGLGWSRFDLYARVLGVEQLLTTGGGWQDQAGALFPGIKLIETGPGPTQAPAIRARFARLPGEGRMLLYWTGITRLAKAILAQIVRDMFLGRGAALRTLELIRANAHELRRALAAGDAAAFDRCIARSWDLNRRLDAGTSTPEIDRILALAGDDLAAGKLLGAGGGGYMFLCARDARAARRLRARLEADPPNARARFTEFSVAGRPLEVTLE